MEEILKEIGFSQEETAHLRSVHDTLMAQKPFSMIIHAAVTEYEKTGTCDYEKIYEDAGRIAQGVHPMQAGLIFFLSLLPEAKRRYREKGLSDTLFAASFSDLVYKAHSTVENHGVLGVYTSWFGRFFDLTRFKIGRLEYETYPLAHDYKDRKAGDTAINIHIPEDGPLDRERVLRSYADAAKFYAEYAINGTLLFVCDSWLLSRELREALPEHSNIHAFALDFDILEYRQRDGFSNAWRVFGKDASLPPEKLPKNTSLQRFYREYLKNHQTTTNGYGAFLYEI